jgi:hypothetical protein
MIRDFEYHSQARRPGTYLALFLGMVSAYAVYVTGAAGWAWWPVSAYLAIVLWLLLMNPSGGLKLSAGRLEVYRNMQSLGIYPLARIEHAKVRSGVFAPDLCTLFMIDGARADLHPNCLPPARCLRMELHKRGVPIL